MKFTKFLFLFFLTQSLNGQNTIDSLSKVISLLKDNNWQIQDCKPNCTTDDFQLDTSMVYSYIDINYVLKEIKGKYIIAEKVIRNGKIVLRLRPFGNARYGCLFRIESEKIIIDYDLEECSDEILEFNENTIKVKRTYNSSKDKNVLITFKKFPFR